MAYLMGMEHRTYLWLHLTFKEIEESAVAGTTEKQLKRSVSALPDSVDKIILNESRKPGLARKFLQCITVARDTLTAKDLNVAMGVWNGCTSYSTLDLEPGDSFISTLTRICGHFVIVHEYRVYLIHQTAREFLIGYENSRLDLTSSKIWQQSIIVEEAEATLAHMCVSLLCFEEFLEKPPYPKEGPMYCDESARGYQEWFDNHPLLTYCSTFWVSHYHSSAEMARHSMHEELRRCYNPKLVYFLNWAPLSLTRVDPLIYSSLFQVCSAFGIDPLVEEILNEISDNNARKSACDDALLIAVKSLRIGTMSLLIEYGADVDVRDENGYPALIMAVYCDSPEAVKFLLEHGANANARRGSESALCIACGRENIEIVELILAHNADVNAVNSYLGCPLL